MTDAKQITPEEVEQLLRRGPFHQWLGIKVLAVHADGVELKATWREEWVVNPERRYTHGGILASLVDLAVDGRTSSPIEFLSASRDAIANRHSRLRTASYITSVKRSEKQAPVPSAGWAAVSSAGLPPNPGHTSSVTELT